MGIKKYNRSEFIKFFLQKKENGDDLMNWTSEELNQCLSAYHNLNSKIKI